MSIIREYRPRHATPAVAIGNVKMGGGNPVVVQAMTDTDTADEVATAIQCAQLVSAGAEMVRITVNTPRAAQAVAGVRARLDDMGIDAPLIGDFHFNGHKLLPQYPACAAALAKYRINPGNVGRGDKHDAQFTILIEQALQHNKAVRIGVNWGSVDQELLATLMDENARSKQPQSAQVVLQQALVQSAVQSAQFAEQLGLAADKIVLSCKTSRIPDLLAVYRELAQTPYALHLGLTEAGMGLRAVAATASALGILLAEGIGDTIRASLTPPAGGDRAEEVQLCCALLQSMGLRAFAPQVTACPGCGRTTSDFFRRLAADIQTHISAKLPQWKEQHPGVENLTIAVMGCIVNGPGESRHADIGISLPGSGENPVAPVYIDGEKATALKGEHIAEEFIILIEEYIARRF
ncbi:MAG: flavodoxin-dependent (E)-4-hydroxy-3-methylbut-2-enyl-diphosphate synthase [Proteobacteria bacterium]|nr:flavodoxin-dependent (E)-4-hydroxy-3-methylbut-2-enyl-diphosphate synthase [Pseudomonadota bacterium]